MNRRCITCGAVGPWTQSRCTAHQAELNTQRDARRRPAKALRYGPEYRAERKRWAEHISQHGYTCARGREAHAPGAPFHLDHINGTLSPSCPYHNQANRP